MNWSSVLANKHFIHGVDKMVKHFGRLDPFEIESSILPYLCPKHQRDAHVTCGICRGLCSRNE